MEDDLIVKALRDRRVEIHRRITAYEAQTGRVKHDLVHVNATLRLFTDEEKIWMAETKSAAELAFAAFIGSYALKYEKAVDCLAKGGDTPLAFYEFRTENWKHLPTTNPIESTFAAVRHRTIPSPGCLPNKTTLAMVSKLVEGAQRSWRRLDCHAQLPKLILGVKFADGLEVIAGPHDRQAAIAAA